MYVNFKKAQTIMGTFPKEVAKPDRRDYDHLSALYLSKKKQVADYDFTGVLAKQLELVVGHVSTCYTIWTQIRSDMVSKSHSIRDLYALDMKGESLPGRNQSPTKRGVARPENVAKAANMRDLTAIWH